MARMLHGSFEGTLALGAHSRNAIWQQFTAIVQEALEDTNISIIEIRDIPELQRIWFAFLLLALILVAVAIAVCVIPLPRISAVAASA